ncbi:hypothetical protein OEA41_002285 [Lepraria neglecta]|uniref:Asl1-like glycosyl hydrolase catalytic domain-containing protein n=1 Tax=Lepraria neglecta TaxID=209136 RepID=A0AAD9ZBB5_9LECA|nr:hypothetical protein OEA41_002285 [Lepraria neglecta]
MAHSYPTGFPHPSGVRGGSGPYESGAHGGYHHHHHPSGAPINTAPFPVGNGNSTGPTGTGTGISGGSSSGVESGSSQTGAPAAPVTIMSTINLIPVPVTTDIYGSPLTTGAPGAPGSSPSESAAPGAPGSGLPGSQAPGSQSPGSQAPGSQSPGSQSPGSQSPGSQSSGSQSPGSQSPGSQSPGESPASGSPGSPGSGAGEAGATCGPATVTVTQAQTVTVTVSPSPPESGAPGVPGTPESGPAQAPSSGPGEQPTFSAPFPIGNASASAGPTGTGTGIIGTGISHPTYHVPVPLPAHSPPTVVEKPKAVINSPAPTEAATEAAPAAPEATSSAVAAPVPVKALYHAPAAQQQQQQQPAAPVQQPYTAASPAEAPTSAAAPVQSSATPQSSTPRSSSGVKARGILYSNSGMSSESALSAANSFDLSNIGWGWNWDSSPAPASGAATGSLNVQFVPMLLTLDSSHTSIWESNCAGAEWIMGFNEPDQCGGGGGCMQVSDVVQGWNTYFAGKSASKVSPATTNDIQTQGKGLSYMSEFLGACTGCHFDALAFHYYGPGSDLTTLKNTVSAYQKLQQQYGIAELWITEMAPTDGPSSSEITSMLSFLDSSGVDRYAFNGLNTGSGVPLTGSMASAYCS